MVKDDTEGTHQGDDSVMVNTLSSNTLHVDCSISYHINYDPAHPEQIISLYSKYRSQFTDFNDFEEKQLRPAFRQAIVDAFGLKNTADVMTGEGKKVAAAYAFKQLNEHFNPDAIVIDEVRIRAIYPDDATVATLRTRLEAQQNLRLSTLNMQLNAITNQRAILAAQAQAEAAHIRASSLTPRLVKFRHIKNIEIVGVPSGAIINLPPDTSAAADAVCAGKCRYAAGKSSAAPKRRRTRSGSAVRLARRIVQHHHLMAFQARLDIRYALAVPAERQVRPLRRKRDARNGSRQTQGNVNVCQRNQVFNDIYAVPAPHRGRIQQVMDVTA